MNNAQTPLDGWKTYIVAALIMAAALFFYSRGELGAAEAMSLILGALGMGSLRHGMPPKG